ncbi:MAG: hypothetical protein M1826_004113 [Phylliscum demangeonii]|nr:MAG: hypothetical protein M1826_004113 [Phylliscum demangeonii]
MHFSTRMLTVAVTASCLLSSAWTLAPPSSVRASSQQALTLGEREDPSQPGRLPQATFLDATINHRNRFRVQKRDIKAHWVPPAEQLAESLTREMASTRFPLVDRRVAECIANILIHITQPGGNIAMERLLFLKTKCEKRHGVGVGAAAGAVASPSPERSQRTIRKGQKATRWGGVMWARHQLDEPVHLLQRINPVRMFRGTAETRAAAMRPFTQGIKTFEKDMELERGL